MYRYVQVDSYTMCYNTVVVYDNAFNVCVGRQMSPVCVCMCGFVGGCVCVYEWLYVYRSNDSPVCA